MATSPPYSATSPILAKKRPFAAPVSHPSKRRKPSTGPSHLRQTSYPPDEPQADLRDGTRSPSIDVENVSMISGVTGGTNRRRRGTTKAASVISANAAGGGTPGAKTTAEEEADEDDEDDEEEGVEGKMDEAEKERNRQRMA
jgi:transcription initiation factor TFIID subunit 11